MTRLFSIVSASSYSSKGKAIQSCFWGTSKETYTVNLSYDQQSKFVFMKRHT